jgi:putative transcriptional regulator
MSLFPFKDELRESAHRRPLRKLAGTLAPGLIGCVLLGGVAVPQPARVAALKRGVLLYSTPGLRDPNFAQTVVLLLEHNSKGSMGVVLNKPTRRHLEDVLDLAVGTGGPDVPVFWGGPVQPEAMIALVRSSWPGPRARTVVRDVQLTSDLADIKQVLAEPNGRLRVRVFTGYSGWGRGQLAAEVRAGGWVVEPAEATTVFSPEPSRMWERVREILRRRSA